MKNKLQFFNSNEDWEYNSRLTKFDNEWLLFGDGYRMAIELIEKSILEEDRTNQDFLIYPYCFLIRHYIEIRLKEVIAEGSKHKGTEVNIRKFGHDLSVIWPISEQILKDIWQKQYESPSKDIKDFIMELQKIDVGSDSFRYPFDKNGKTTLETIDIINFRNLSAKFQIVKLYLDGVTDGIAVLRDQ